MCKLKALTWCATTRHCKATDEVDQAIHRVTVGAGSAYDLFLTRHLKHAAIVRAPTSPAVVDVFMAQQLEVAAGVKQQLQADAQRLGGVRLLPGRFMVIHQAMGMPAQRSEPARQFLNDFVEDAKQSGWVAQAFVRHARSRAQRWPRRAIPHTTEGR
jgi:polar amino acid transport system substrate-binding protein